VLWQNHHHLISDDAAAELARQTDGWITGLLLSAQSLGPAMLSRVRDAIGSGKGLYEYLAEQVLALLDAGMCDAILGEERNWFRLINRIVQNNLFVSQAGADGSWVRYHHLFRDFLQLRLKQERPREEKRLLRRLAEWYAGREEWEKSFQMYWSGSARQS
jgi:LuxR family maltose regulon positive regulatory protein